MKGALLVYATRSRASHVHSERNDKPADCAPERPRTPPICNCTSPSPQPSPAAQGSEDRVTLLKT